MKTLHVGWGDEPYVTRTVATLAELDAVLAEATAARDSDGLPYLVGVWNLADVQGEGDPEGLQVGIAEQRARVQWMGNGDSEGYSPDVSPWMGEEIAFNFGHVPTEETPETLRVLPAAALEAAREFMMTGQRPTGLEWFKG
ncbi:Imm1 family immunity protein [Longispora urticae]